jgi:hypothetical protein
VNVAPYGPKSTAKPGGVGCVWCLIGRCAQLGTYSQQTRAASTTPPTVRGSETRDTSIGGLELRVVETDV